jgi:acyl-CoA synthetase (AMP-forming)/AMP-acid ligase II
MGDVGYLDDSGRLWFCGRKKHRVETPNGPLYPVPCEAVFDEHPDVKKTALVGVEGTPFIVAELEPGTARPREDIARELLELGAAHAHTRLIRDVLFHPSFPVDVRHNAKIHREQLAEWAARGRAPSR